MEMARIDSSPTMSALDYEPVSGTRVARSKQGFTNFWVVRLFTPAKPSDNIRHAFVHIVHKRYFALI